MEPKTHPSGNALAAYEHLAPVYDNFTAHHDYGAWWLQLRELLESRGFRGHRVLDVACGTGKSFEPLAQDGWLVVACDISPAMVERARERACGFTEIRVADMRELPRLGTFDLAICLGDALNYLLTAGELIACFEGIHANLLPGGFLLADTNTLATYRTLWRERIDLPLDDSQLTWQGMADPDPRPGMAVEGQFRLTTAGSGPSTAFHHQRHFPVSVVTETLRAAGFERIEVFGQGLDGDRNPTVDEDRDTKALYLAQRTGGE